VNRVYGVLTALLVWWAPIPSWAQPPAEGAVEAGERPPAMPPGEDRIEYLPTRTPAPFEGMLLDVDTAIRWMNARRWYQNELRLRERRAEEILRAVRESQGRELALVEASYRREILGLRQDLRDQARTLNEALVEARRDPPFYKTFGFGLLLGVGVSVLIAAGTAVLVLAI
jgi:hypothetical protein